MLDGRCERTTRLGKYLVVMVPLFGNLFGNKIVADDVARGHRTAAQEETRAQRRAPADVLSRCISSGLFFSRPLSPESSGAFASLGRRLNRLFSYRRSDGACRGVDQQSYASLGLFNIVQHMADVDDPGAVSGPCAEPQFEKAAEASQIGVDLKKTKESLLIGGRFDGPIESRIS